jgi:large subunit ribosomal protein L25
MSQGFDLIAEVRQDQGKGASRRLRHAGRVPAILYGGKADPLAVSLDHTRLALVMENEKFYSSIVNIQVAGKNHNAILRDVQRHPWKNVIVHVDFQRVAENELIRMTVPLHFSGEAIAPGVKTQGGMMSHLRNDILIECLPKDLPEFIGVDVSGLALNQSLHLSQLSLPAGVQSVELKAGRDPAVVAVHAQRAEEVEAAPVAAAATAAAAAPAAAGAKPEAGAKPAAEPPKKDAKK